MAILREVSCEIKTGGREKQFKREILTICTLLFNVRREKYKNMRFVAFLCVKKGRIIDS